MTREKNAINDLFKLESQSTMVVVVSTYIKPPFWLGGGREGLAHWCEDERNTKKKERNPENKK